MFNIPSLDKYKFYVGKDRVIAVSTYAGRPVRGVAKCASEDKFDLETGKKLAAARCNYKIAMKRAKRATQKYHEAIKTRNSAQAKVEAMSSYQTDANAALGQAYIALTDLLDEI